MDVLRGQSTWTKPAGVSPAKPKQTPTVSSVSNGGKASILGILALPRSLCVINASRENTLAHRAYQIQCRGYNLRVHS